MSRADQVRRIAKRHRELPKYQLNFNTKLSEADIEKFRQEWDKNYRTWHALSHL